MSDEPITAEDLHRHVQGTVFSIYGDKRRFNDFQARLHDLVDRPSDVEIICAFVGRVEKRADAYDAGGWTQAHHKALRDELAAMEAEVKE